MRKFIISDLHGDGNIYKSIMYYLENVNKNEKVILYINGDLIDKGIESAEILLDVKRRMIEGPFEIEYIGGNHELLMFQVFSDGLTGLDNKMEWHDNGGWITDYGLEDTLVTDEERTEMLEFIANLKIYHKFHEKINGKNIVMAHAACPVIVKDECRLRIKDNNFEVKYCTWSRKNDPTIPFKTAIGNPNYFSIVGHTPNNSILGCEYYNNGGYLNIDGGCACYVSGFFDFDHVPLIEIKDGYLKILTFNHSNEIMFGNYFFDGIFLPFESIELDRERSYLNTSFHPKKLVRFKDNVVGYEDWYKKNS